MAHLQVFFFFFRNKWKKLMENTKAQYGDKASTAVLQRVVKLVFLCKTFHPHVYFVHYCTATDMLYNYEVKFTITQ